MNKWGQRSLRMRVVRVVAAMAATVVLQASGGCSRPADSPGSLAGGSTPATRSPTPVPTDAEGNALTPPSCVKPGDGRYLRAPGALRLTSILLMSQGPRGVVIGAQGNGGICQLLPFARDLVNKGYHVAIFDWTWRYRDAMAAATKSLIDDGAAKVALGGFSRGALVGLGVAPSLGPRIVGVFAVSGGPSASEGFATVASLSKFDGPILLIGSVDDPLFPLATTKAIAKAHAGPETVVTVPGYEHAMALLEGPNASAVQGALDEFLLRVLR